MQSEPVTASEPPVLSKNALKRLRKAEEWAAGRDERSKQRKLKKQQRAEKRKRMLAEGVITEDQVKKKRFVEQEEPSVDVVIDLAFDHLMSEKEVKSTARQLCHCHAANKATPKPFRYHLFTPEDSLLRKKMGELLPGHANWKNCQVHDSLDLVAAFPDKSKLVYLSADAEEVLYELKDDEVYILGGIVDKNRHKNICLEKAKELGIRAAQLPIGQFVNMSSRKVLTVNQVFSILLKQRENGDWKDAFYSVIPERKLKNQNQANKVETDVADNEDEDSEGRCGEEEADDKENELSEEAGCEEAEDEVIDKC